MHLIDGTAGSSAPPKGSEQYWDLQTRRREANLKKKSHQPKEEISIEIMTTSTRNMGFPGGISGEDWQVSCLPVQEM